MTDRTIVTFLLDRSGSMGAIKGATIEAFNAYLAELKGPGSDGIDFTFLQFDTQAIDKVHVAIPVAEVPELTVSSYQPRGGTPLIDAAVKTIRAVETAAKAGDKIVVCFQTDGEENSSREHTWEELAELVREKTEAGWQFNFLGAGIDAYVPAAKMGIAAVNAMSYDHTDLAATRASFRASAENARTFAAGARVDVSYSATQRVASGDRFAAPDLTLATVGSPPIGLDLTRPDARRGSTLDLTRP